MADDDVSIHIREEQPSKNEEKYVPKHKRTTMKEIMAPQGKYILMWNKIFLVGCVVAVMLDPLFFYIPLIKEEKKCVALDNKLKNTALILRSVMDLTYIVHIVFQIRSALSIEASARSKGKLDATFNRGFLKRALGAMRWIPWWHILIDILAVLPIPQVVVLLFIVEMRVSRSRDNRKLLNILILFQYVPRIYRIYLSCKEYTRHLSAYTLTGTAWAKGLFNFFLYIIASHVAGAFWYLFAIERETACWQYACEKQNGCNNSTKFDCGDFKVDQTIIDLLHKSCPLNPPNPSLFDFGIFSSAVQSGIVDSTGFLRKLFYCFGWGLRNLSSFGSNLQPSTYRWENLFADAITITGLLLFIYLIGNLQTYLQLAAIKSEERRSMMKKKELDIDLWVRKNGIPQMRNEIMHYARLKFHENKEVDLKNLLNILPWESKRHIKHHLCFAIIKKVPELQKLDDQFVHDIFVNHLKPVIFEEHGDIIREGEPIDRMLFFTQGTVLTYKINKNETSSLDHSPSTEKLEKGDFHGEELLQSALKDNALSDLPISTKTLKAHTKIEAFALMARNLSILVSSYRRHFGDNIDPNSRGSNVAASKIRAALGRRS